MKNIDKIFRDTIYKQKTLRTRKCEKCGHSIDFASGLQYVLCTWCGAKIYKNDKTKFKVEIEKRLKQKSGGK